MKLTFASSVGRMVCTTAGLALISIAVGSAPAQAFFKNYNEAWCAQMGDGIEDCSYFTWQQCRAAASGTGNFCYANPRYFPQNSRKPKRIYDRR
jgi:hypothetical protein